MSHSVGVEPNSKFPQRVRERQIRSYTINIKQSQSPINSQEKRVSTIIQPLNSYREQQQQQKKQSHFLFQKSTLTNKQLRIQHKKYYQQQYQKKTSKQLLLDQPEKAYLQFINISQLSQESKPLPIVINKKKDLVKFKFQRLQFSLF